MIIAEGPCEVTAKTFRLFAGRTVCFEAEGPFVTYYDVVPYAGGVRLHHVTFRLYDDIPNSGSLSLKQGQRYSIGPKSRS